MSRIERFLETIGLTTQTSAATIAKRAYEQGFDDGGEDEPTSGTLARYGYRTATGHGTRDFNRLDWDSIINNVWSVYQSNPVADRALEIKRDHILGRGVMYQVDNDDLAEVLDTFRAVNKFDQRLKEFVKQLYLFGVQCYPVFVRQSDGLVRLGYIDPGLIEDVITHPENAMEIWAIVVKAQQGLPAWAGLQKRRRVYRLIRIDEGVTDGDTVTAPAYPDRLVTAEQATLDEWEQVMLREHGLQEYTGSCFYARVNSVSNQPRGYSDLLRIIDWLDQHDETLFGLADREQMAGYFFADVTLTGLGEAEIQKRATQLRRNPPKRGSVNVHNDKEEWNLHHPDLKQQPSVLTAEALFDHAWGGLGYPRHWYVQGDRTNRATAQEQAAPAERSLQSDQDDVKELITQILTFQRDQAEIAGSLSLPDEEREFEVILPEIVSRDITKIAAALAQIILSISQALAEGLMTREQAIELWAKAVSETGVEIDIAEIMELETMELETAEAASDWLVSRLGANGNAK